jgi:polar amino acid transport system substrate-binding protein
MQRAVPTSFRALRTLAAALIGLTAFAAAATATAATFDLSPEQRGRPRGTADTAVERAVPASFKFAEPGTLTIGIAPSLPPISSYATDARTVIGFDADIGQLVSDSLGR